MTVKRKKIGSAGRFGAGYGRIKQKLVAVEVKQRTRQECPFCKGRAKRQAKAIWMEKFDKRKTPQGRDYYWLTGEFVNQDHGEDTDEWALANGYVSIVPVQFDLTAHHAIQQLNTWKWNE